MSFLHFIVTILIFYTSYFAILLIYDRNRRNGSDSSSALQTFSIAPGHTDQHHIVNLVANDNVMQQEHPTIKIPNNEMSHLIDTDENVPDGQELLVDIGLETISSDSFGIDVTKENALEFIKGN